MENVSGRGGSDTSMKGRSCGEENRLQTQVFKEGFGGYDQLRKVRISVEFSILRRNRVERRRVERTDD